MARRHGLEKPSHVVVEERQEGILIKKLESRIENDDNKKGLGHQPSRPPSQRYRAQHNRPKPNPGRSITKCL